MFFAYGLIMVLSSQISFGILGFSIFSMLYGVIGLCCLYLALRKIEKNIIKIFKYSSLVYLLIFVVASFDVGMISGQEFLLIVFIGMFLLLNWVSIKAIINRV